MTSHGGQHLAWPAQVIHVTVLSEDASELETGDWGLVPTSASELNES